MEDLKEELVGQYPQIHQVIRLKNKYQNDIKLVKLELLSHTVRDELLAAGKVRVYGMTYDISEYLAPATVLICSKCMGIGHFRRQCQQVNETCKTCGDSFQELRHHQCSTVNKCIHCDGDHVSNSQRCPVVKEFRSLLTKQLLGRNLMPQASAWATSERPGANYTYVHSQFPPLPNSMPFARAPVPRGSEVDWMKKLDEISQNTALLKDALDTMAKKNEEMERLLVSKIRSDEIVIEKIQQLVASESELRTSVTRHEKLIQGLILPTLELIAKFAYHANSKQGGVDDADFKSQIETRRVILNKVMGGKDF